MRSWFAHESACLSYLEKLRWGKRFCCPKCESSKWWRMSDGCRCCSRCGHKTSVTAGTIFDRHRILLKHWFITGWYLAELENGISALELQQEFGLGSYQSAWTIAHKLRSAMSLAVQDRLYDSAVVDITYVGGIQKECQRAANEQTIRRCSCRPNCDPMGAAACAPLSPPRRL
jgi:hypothetical protein